MRCSGNDQENGGDQLAPSDKLVIESRLIKSIEIMSNRIGVRKNRKWPVHYFWNAWVNKANGKQYSRKGGEELKNAEGSYLCMNAIKKFL